MPFEYSHKNCLLFDLDGTLVDSSAAHADAFAWALGTRHPGLASAFDYRPYRGRPTPDVFPALGITDPEEVAVLTRAKQERYRGAVGRGEVRLFPGAREVLAALRGEGRRLFVVTGASRLSAQSVLRANRIDALFEGVTAAEDAHSGKPSAAPYSHTLELHNLAVADCLAIEDAAAGVASARAAGIDVVLVNTECVVPGVPSLGPIGMLASLILS